MCTDRLYTFTEAAQALGIPENSLRKKAAQGAVPHHRVFRHTRFTDQDLACIVQPRPALRSARGLG